MAEKAIYGIKDQTLVAWVLLAWHQASNSNNNAMNGRKKLSSEVSGHMLLLSFHNLLLLHKINCPTIKHFATGNKQPCPQRLKDPLIVKI